MKIFYHSGKIGDIIYSLPTVNAMGGGEFVTGLPRDQHDCLYPLLVQQEYIHTASHVSERDLPGGFINFDAFRLEHNFRFRHIADSHASSQQVTIIKDQ